MEIKSYVVKAKEILAEEIKEEKANPLLVIIQMNDDYASDKYIAGKIKDAIEVGITTRHYKLPPTTPKEELFNVIEEVNSDNSVHGIIVQLPLPKHINEEEVKRLVNPQKDVDGFNPLSTFKACTPLGIINYLKTENISMRGKNALVIGRSNIVGKPVASLLLQEDANVTIVHSKTKIEDLEHYLSRADIIVVAVGIANYLSEQIVKEDAVIVDVGINRDENGLLVGDVRSGRKVKLQTPVPGGVGLLTRLTLLQNVWEAYKNGI